MVAAVAAVAGVATEASDRDPVRSMRMSHPTGVGDSTAEGLQQPLSKPQDIALRLGDRLKAAAAEEATD